jgi:hypothetical protein
MSCILLCTFVGYYNVLTNSYVLRIILLNFTESLCERLELSIL